MSVTAVPLRPLARGTVAKLWLGILAVLLLGAGLAWLGTAPLQFSTTDAGVRYRAIEQGKGEPVTPEDLVELEFEIRRADGTMLDNSARTGQAIPATVTAPFPGLRDLILQMREGGIYQAFLSAEQAIGQPLPPGGRVPGNEILEFRLRVGSILRGMASMQSMIGRGGGAGSGNGPSGPGGQAMPEGAMPADPGAMAPPPPATKGR